MAFKCVLVFLMLFQLAATEDTCGIDYNVCQCISKFQLVICSGEFVTFFPHFPYGIMTVTRRIVISGSLLRNLPSFEKNSWPQLTSIRIDKNTFLSCAVISNWYIQHTYLDVSGSNIEMCATCKYNHLANPSFL